MVAFEDHRPQQGTWPAAHLWQLGGHHIERPKTRQFVNPGFKTRPRGKPGFGFGFRVCSKPWFLLLDICSQENVVKKCFAIAFPPQKMQSLPK